MRATILFLEKNILFHDFIEFFLMALIFYKIFCEFVFEYFHSRGVLFIKDVYEDNENYDEHANLYII